MFTDSKVKNERTTQLPRDGLSCAGYVGNLETNTLSLIRSLAAIVPMLVANDTFHMTTGDDICWSYIIMTHIPSCECLEMT